MSLLKPGLTAGQKSALEAMLNGQNVFLTGNAGTGKSYILQEFLKKCARRHNVIACAPTGIAALRLKNGSTIHRAFRLPFLQAYDHHKHIHPTEEILNAEIIIIDEISMCRVDLFDYIAEIIFEADEATGFKRQVIVVGDFFQLPPVLRGDEREVLRNKYPDIQAGFCFAGDNWKRFDFEPFILTEVVRQNESEYINMLNKARSGDTSCLPYFNARATDDLPSNAINLVPTNAKAAAINSMRLNELKGERVIFKARTSGTVSAGDKSADDELVLKPEARVIALCNDLEYRNGQIGTVKKIFDDHVLVAWDNGKKSDVELHDWNIVRPEWDGSIIKHANIGTFTQIPLRLAYAITIHKSQGQTYERANIDPYCFDIGQLYVALSRCESIDGMALSRKAFPNALRCSGEVKRFYSELSGDPIIEYEDASYYEFD